MENISDIALQIQNGAVGVLPTDTIYGIVTSVNHPQSVARIYEAKGRPEHKKFILLVADFSQLSYLGIELSDLDRKTLSEYWPGPFSVILKSSEHGNLTADDGTIAVRMPALDWLRELIALTGPIVATSANLSGVATPTSIEEIQQQLPGLDFYIEGPVGDTPSRLIRLHEDGSVEEIAR